MNTSESPSFLDRNIIDPAFNLTEKLAVGAITLSLDLLRKGVKALVNGVVDLVIPVHHSN